MTAPEMVEVPVRGLRCLTLYPEHAEGFACGIRNIETRGWATKHRGPIALHAGMRDPDSPAARRSPQSRAILNAIPHGRGLTRGAIVATANLVDVVPILAAGADPSPGRDEWVKHVAPLARGGLRLWDGPTYPENQSTGRPTWSLTDIEDQRPYGDFAPGRFAWLLDDIKPTTERCPACWVTRAKAEWVGAHLGECSACAGGGHCDPIPAKGKQGLWTWQP